MPERSVWWACTTPLSSLDVRSFPAPRSAGGFRSGSDEPTVGKEASLKTLDEYHALDLPPSFGSFADGYPSITAG